MSDKLFKDSQDLRNFDKYVQYIENTTKPIGFGEKGDEVFERTKAYLFLSLYHLVKDSGPSFDAEIYFSSIIGDLNETFDTVGPSLLKLQRDIHDPAPDYTNVGTYILEDEDEEGEQ